MSLAFRIVLAVLFTGALARAEEPGAFILRPGASWRPPPGSVFLRTRITKIIESEQRRERSGATDPVFAPSCVRAPTLSDFFDLSEVNGPARSPATTGQLPDLRKPAAKILDLFTVLRQTRWGSAVLKKFMPRFGFDIRIEHFTDAMREEELRQGRAAAAVYDIDRKTIYVDRTAPIGTVAPILLHEIVHSLDNDFARSVERERQLWSQYDSLVNRILQTAAARTGRSETDLERGDFTPQERAQLGREKVRLEEYRDVRIFRAERVASDMYSQIVAELATLAPGSYPTVKPGKVPLFSDAELIATEHLDPSAIARYQKGLCKTR